MERSRWGADLTSGNGAKWPRCRGGTSRETKIEVGDGEGVRARPRHRSPTSERPMRLHTQDRILFRLYCMVKFHAQSCVPRAQRTDVIKSVLLQALILLREGLWSIPKRELSDYARHAIGLQSPELWIDLASRAPELATELEMRLGDWAHDELPIEEKEMERAIEIVY